MITEPDIYHLNEKLSKALRNETTAISEVVVFARNVRNIFAALRLNCTSDFCSGEEQRYAFGFLRHRPNLAEVTQVLNLESDLFLRSGKQKTSSRLQLRVTVTIEVVCYTVNIYSMLKKPCNIIGGLLRRSWSGR